MINIEAIEISGWEAAIRGMRNPMNSWAKSDSRVYNSTNPPGMFILGKNDKKLCMKLAANGPVHSKYRRMIVVHADITAPLYWWKEYDTYKVGTVTNSCSTMHKIAEKEFEIDDFSHEHLIGLADDCVPENFEIYTEEKLSRIACNEDCPDYPKDVLDSIIYVLNLCRKKYLETKDKRYWWQMIQLLPSSYNQKRTVMLNYEVLSNIYKHRADHKLDEWIELCKWIEKLPYSELLTGAREEKGEEKEETNG